MLSNIQKFIKRSACDSDITLKRNDFDFLWVRFTTNPQQIEVLESVFKLYRYQMTGHETAYTSVLYERIVAERTVQSYVLCVFVYLIPPRNLRHKCRCNRTRCRLPSELQTTQSHYHYTKPNISIASR